MAYTMEDLIADCRRELAGGETPESPEAVRGFVREALADKTFVAEHFAGRSGPDREVVYEDPDLGFCICLHVYAGARSGQPHDHGPTWAVYGQAEGETEMTDWRVVAPAGEGQPAKVEKVRSYTLRPGDAHAYPIGAVHAPIRHDATKLLRIEGRNTDKVQRTPLIAA